MRLKSPTADTATPDQAEKPTSYRTLGAMAGGAALAAMGLFGAVAFSVGSEKHYLASAIAFALAVAGVVGGVYPVALAYADRLVVRNPFRTIVAAWPRVESVDARLSMVLTTTAESSDSGTADGAKPSRKYTIWSIPVSLRQRRKMDRQVSKVARAGRMESMRSAKAAGNADSFAHGGRSQFKPAQHDPIDLLAFADQAVQEIMDRKRYCSTPVADAAPTTVRWNPWTAGASALATLLIVLTATGVLK